MFGEEVDKAILAGLNDKSEVCGYITSGKARFKPNVADDPETEFLIDRIPKRVQGIFHSHPGGPYYPSHWDMAQQIASDIPWGIAVNGTRGAEVFWWGGAHHAPLVGRGFRHGVTDCYSLIRDFYREVHGIVLRDYPREWEWWDEGDNHYLDNVAKEGFREISLTDALPGDMFFAQIRARVPNHAGIYLGNNLILHHTSGAKGYDPGHLSTVEPVTRWQKYLYKVYRHENHSIDRSVGQGVWPRVPHGRGVTGGSDPGTVSANSRNGGSPSQARIPGQPPLR